MKECFKCNQVLPLSDFYKHSQMADGHVNKCKACNKADVVANRKAKVEYYREYDRDRGNRQSPEYYKGLREKYPQQYRARNKVNNSIRDGKLIPASCELCDSTVKAHAHHHDYLLPLDIQWLCPVCHKAWHDGHGHALNR